MRSYTEGICCHVVCPSVLPGGKARYLSRQPHTCAAKHGHVFTIPVFKTYSSALVFASMYQLCASAHEYRASHLSAHTLMCVLLQAALQAGYEMPQGEYLSTWSTIPADASGIGQVAGFPMHDVNAIEAKLKEAHCKFFGSYFVLCLPVVILHHWC